MKLMVVGEEIGDDLMVYSAVNYILRGLCEPFMPRGGERRDMSPAEIREFAQKGGSRPGYWLLAVVLSAQPPTLVEAARMDQLNEVSPKSAAAILAAQEHHVDFVVIAPNLRLRGLIASIKETADCIKNEDERWAFIESSVVTLRCGAESIPVSAPHFVDSPDFVAGYFARAVAMDHESAAASDRVKKARERHTDSAGADGDACNVSAQ